MEGYYRCEVCGGFHLVGYSHDEWLDYQRGLRGWDEEGDKKEQKRKNSLRWILRYSKNKKIRISPENKNFERRR